MKTTLRTLIEYLRWLGRLFTGKPPERKRAARRTKLYCYGREDSPERLAAKYGVSKQWVYANRRPAPEPTFDPNGLPSTKTLNTIRGWECQTNYAIMDLMRYVRKAWHGGGRIRRAAGTITLMTCGHPINEALIAALRDNVPFWTACWKSTRSRKITFQTKPFNETLPKSGRRRR